MPHTHTRKQAEEAPHVLAYGAKLVKNSSLVPKGECSNQVITYVLRTVQKDAFDIICIIANGPPSASNTARSRW